MVEIDSNSITFKHCCPTNKSNEQRERTNLTRSIITTNMLSKAYVMYMCFYLSPNKYTVYYTYGYIVRS